MTDKTALLTGQHMVAGLRAILVAVALRGQELIDDNVDAPTLKKLLTLGLKKVDQEVGRSIDADTLPQYLKRLVEYFLDDPFELTTITTANFKVLHELAMDRAELVEA